jgi:hypothetical protein
MTTDIERELRELFREKAGEAPTATLDSSGSAPQEVLRRGRRRQVGTVLGSAAIVLVLVVGSVAGLNAVLRGEEDPFTTGDYDVFERTATIEAFTVTSPSDWYLVNEWPLSMQMAVGSGSSSGECTAAPPGAGQPSPVCTSSEPSVQFEPLPQGLPMFQLSNADMGLDAVSCGQDLPADAAVLYVGLDYQRAIFGAKDPSIGPWPVGLEEPAAAGGPCGAGRYATFSVNGEPFFAWVGFGDDVTESDRSTVLAAYESLAVNDGWEPIPPNAGTPAYVIAGGEYGPGDDWRLELRPEGNALELSLQDGPAPTVLLTDGSVEPLAWTGTDPIFGAITKQAVAVEFRSKDDPSVAIAGTIVPLPPSMAFDFDLFFIEDTAGVDGEAVAVGPDGDVIEGDTTVGRLRKAVVELPGSLLGQDWSARFSGAFADQSACIRVTVAEPSDPLCIEQLDISLAGGQPSMHLWVTTELAVFAGSVPPEVAELRFTSDDGTQPPSQLRCQTGPIGWTNPDKNVCAIALPPEGSGTMQYLDANGTVLFEEGNGWGSGTATAASEWGVAHGSTFGQRWDLVLIRGGNQSPRLVLRGADGDTVIEIRPQLLEIGGGLAGRQYAIVDQADSTRWTTMIFGLADPSTDQVSIALETGQVLQASLRSQQVNEPSVWWVFVDGSVQGEIVALTSDCREVARTAFATESASQPSPSPSIPNVECVGP